MKPCLHGGVGLVVCSGHPPYTITHLIREYHADIPWISMSSCGFCGTAYVAKKETHDVYYVCVVVVHPPIVVVVSPPGIAAPSPFCLHSALPSLFAYPMGRFQVLFPALACSRSPLCGCRTRTASARRQWCACRRCGLEPPHPLLLPAAVLGGRR